MTIPTPDLTTYDLITIQSSGGKDSQAMLDLMIERAGEAGVRDRVSVIHADLGRIEWPGTKELAILQASLYGLPTTVVAMKNGDLLAHIERRGMWPDAARRYCTSDAKRGPCLTALTAKVRELNLGRQARILNCMGMRAQESKARAKRVPLTFDKRASNGKRHVDTYLPIHAWTVEQVWERIAASGVPFHPAYAAGMPRLSCCFCVLASTSALVRAAQLQPALAADYLAAENRMGHTFRKDLSMARIIEMAATTPTDGVTVADWAA